MRGFYMWHTALITGLLVFAPNTFDAWAWPLWLLTSPVGYWFMDSDQKRFYTTVRAFNTDKNYKSHYLTTLKKLMVPMTAQDQRHEDAFLKARYATYGYLYKIDQVLAEKVFFTNDKISTIDKSILRKNQHKSKEYVHFDSFTPPCDFLPNPIKEKYEKLCSSLANNIAVLEKEQFWLKQHGAPSVHVDSYLKHQCDRLAALEIKREAEENEEFTRLKLAYLQKVLMIKKQYPTVCSHKHAQKLQHHLREKALFYKKSCEELSQSIALHNMAVEKNSNFYNALLQKYEITIA